MTTPTPPRRYDRAAAVLASPAYAAAYAAVRAGRTPANDAQRTALLRARVLTGTPAPADLPAPVREGR